jgi:hypothetical protein
MDQSLTEYYDNQFEMFNTKGWKDFIEDANVELTNAKEGSDLVCITNDMWQYNRGQMSKLRAIVNYENFVKQSYEMAINEENEDEL